MTFSPLVSGFPKPARQSSAEWRSTQPCPSFAPRGMLAFWYDRDAFAAERLLEVRFDHHQISVPTSVSPTRWCSGPSGYATRPRHSCVTPLNATLHLRRC